ncbi:Uncharacterised protein [Vibrio cholerae]|nr:Uncharacterised protein [Vibrio cholerae]CSI53689.1 Uncharacterised protein [Vibrio cholerae]
MAVGEITTPPACLPALRVQPSRIRHLSISSLTSSSASYSSCSAGSAIKAFSSVIPGSGGTNLEMRSTKPNG